MAHFPFDHSASTTADPATVWSLMTDVPRLVRWITVLDNAEEHRRLESYSAVIQDKVGMFSLRADLDITVVEVREPEYIRVRAEGRDRQIGSRITIETSVDVTPGADETTVHVHGSYEITGRAATLGSSQIKRKGEKVLTEFFDNLTAELQEAG